MKYRQVRPGEAASRFVECYWTLEEDNSGSIQRIVPDGSPELIFNFRQPFECLQVNGWSAQPDCFFAGQLTGPLRVRCAGQAQMLGVRFRPPGAPHFLGLPMHELTGSIRALDDLSPSLGRKLERVCARSSTAEQITAFESLLENRDERDALVSHSVQQIVHAGGIIDLRRLADNLGISLRQLERRFHAEVGLSPKLFSRIQRFQRVFRLIEDGRPGWADAAVECGYYDQAHLIRDFRDFAGEPPSSLLVEADLATHFLRYSAVSHFSNTNSVNSANLSS